MEEMDKCSNPQAQLYMQILVSRVFPVSQSVTPGICAHEISCTSHTKIKRKYNEEGQLVFAQNKGKIKGVSRNSTIKEKNIVAVIKF